MNSAARSSGSSFYRKWKAHSAAQIVEIAAALDHRRRKPNEKRFAVRAQINWAKERRMRTVRRNMGQLHCQTKPPSASRCATVQPDEYPEASNASLRRLLMSQRRTFRLFRSEPFTEAAAQKKRNRRTVGYCPCRNSCSGGRSASQKKSKREVRHAKQGSDRPDVAAAPPASPEPASATIISIATFAQNLRCHSDTDASVRGP